MKIAFADKCAWRAVYVYAGDRQLFRIGIDPTADTGPQFFGAILDRSIRFTLPHVKYRHAAYCRPRFLRPVMFELWRVSDRFYRRLDGRYRLRLSTKTARVVNAIVDGAAFLMFVAGVCALVTVVGAMLAVANQ